MRRPDPGAASRTFIAIASAIAMVNASAGCSSDPDPQGNVTPPPVFEPPPASVVVEEGAVKIRREVFLVPGFVPPANPEAAANGSTPPEYNFVRVVRYRVDADPPLPARAIAVMMPGFLGGAGSYDSLARAVVRRSKDGMAFESWAIDRRSNLLEDHHGLDVAEVKKDPELASAYYFQGEEVEGKTFPGFKQTDEIPFQSEWGLETTVEDLRRVIQIVGEGDRKSRVVLIGHSLGASVVEEYAAWDFKGQPGYAELAGLVLVDGISGAEGAASPTMTEDDYHKGTGMGLSTTPGLDAARTSTSYVALPLLGLDIYPTAAAVSMRAVWSPLEVTEDPQRNKAFQTLLSLTSIPPMTNRAAMGFAFDNESNGVTFAAVSCGKSKGGALEKYTSLLGPELVHPTDSKAQYEWIEHDETTPPEATSIDDIARSWYEGPGLDFAEWYFPARLALDVQAAKTLVLKAGDWPLDKFSMRAMHGAEMDLPIFGAVAGLVADTAKLDNLRALVDKVPIGPGRPLEGAPRTDPDAWRTLDISDLTHIDPLSATDSGSGSGPKWFDALAAWMEKNTPPGGVSVAIQASE